MHSKHRAIKSFIAEFTAILLYQFPVTFQCSVFVRFPVELIHNLNTDTVHSTTKVLHDMKAIDYNLSIGECNSLGIDCFSLSSEIEERRG